MLQQAFGLVVLLLMGGLAYLFAIVWTMRWRLTHPPRRTYAHAVARGIAADPSELSPPLDGEEWTFSGQGVELPVWDVKGRNLDGPVIVLSHGWADSRIGSLVRLPTLAAYASRLVAWDLPGHGEAAGASRLGTREVACIERLLERLETPVVLYGWSLGAGLSIEAAAELPERVLAVIAEAPYRFPETPARNVLRQTAMPSGMTLTLALASLGLTGKGRARFDRCAHAARLSCPLLVIHGDADPICPVDDGRAIAEAAADGTFALIEGGDHNQLWTDPELRVQCEQAVESFFAGLGDYHGHGVDSAGQPHS